jgi:signal transduction histidine kinase/CheY-like chemotaxis protein
MRGTADAYPFRTLPAPLRFAIALASIAAVFLVDRVGGTAIDDGTHFLLLGTAVMASAWFAGTGPALAATVLGAILGAIKAGDAGGSSAATHLAVFVLQGLLLTALVSELRAARRTAERQARDAQVARQEGEAANRMKDEFLATVSHELRTPLNAVLGWVHLLRTGKLDAPTSTRGLESIERNIRLQSQLTSDLLDVSKALTGKLQLDSHPTLITEAVRLAVAAVGPAARAKGVTVDASLPDKPAVVLGDSNRLRQITWHLLANAIKFTPRGGTVELTVGTSDDQVWLTVQDSGHGIDPEFLPRIFDRFTQADSSATRTAGGLGVGLALVRELVELHAGEIEARNRPGAAGAIFTARFPLQSPELMERVPERTAPGPLPVACPPLDGVRVLVLDQDQDARELLRTVLQQRGAAVRAVDSVAEALESLEGWHPDVLVSDSGSPEHDSYALFGRVQSLDADRGGRIPALALTAAARNDERLSHLLAGVQRDFPKPIEPALLTAEIARLTGRERRRAQR